METKFKLHERVKAHPATESFMMGDRYGQVVNIGRKYIHVLMDKSNRVKKFNKNYLIKMED